jgi:hypothetical protein
MRDDDETRERERQQAPFRSAFGDATVEWIRAGAGEERIVAQVRLLYDLHAPERRGAREIPNEGKAESCQMRTVRHDA